MSKLPKNKKHSKLEKLLKRANFTAEQLGVMEDFLVSINAEYVDVEAKRIKLENKLKESSHLLKVANENLDQALTKVKTTSKAKNQLGTIVENIDDIIFETDLQGKYTFLNSVWEKTTGYPVAESIGKNFTDFVDLLDPSFLDAVNALKTGNYDALNRVFKINTNKKSIWIKSRVQLLLDKNGNPTGFTGMYQDITTIKETELKLIEASSVKDEFLSTMSHEIRTPLNAVLGMSNMLMLNDPKPEQIDTLNALKFSSKHLLNLVNDILDVNKLRAGKLKMRNEEFGLKEMLIGLKDSFSYTASTKDIDLIFDIDDQIPELIIGDQLRISQVLTNLLGNAMKFVEHGSVKLTCKLLQERDNFNKIFFEVTDTGIGIPEEKLDLIFEKFTQADIDTAKKYGGTGLGLTLCKGFLDQYDSKLYVTSEVGKGTKFSFTLDLEKSTCCKENINKNLSQSKENIKGLDILIVEDNTMNIMVLENYFSLWEISYDVAKNGQEALDKVGSKDYDVVLMDLRMPVMDGYEATKFIRSVDDGKHAELPIIALSASVSQEVEKRVKVVGMNDYMVKPFAPEELIEKINKQVSQTPFKHTKSFQISEVKKDTDSITN